MTRTGSAAAAAALLALGVAACSPSDALAPQAEQGASLSTAVTADAPTTLTTAKIDKAQPEHLDRTRFNISLKYVVPMTDAQKAVFEEAARHWERIIIADIASISGTVPSAFAGMPPASSTVIDDIVIEVALTYIDGPGVNGRNVLGSAGPRYVRLSDGLPLSGVMYFDTYDLGLMDERGIFDEVIKHEMGHVLGIGTLWNLGAPFPARQLRTGAPANYAFVGKHANIQWNAEGGTGLLPIANVGAAGSIGGHWRESVLFNELMTPSIGGGVNPLSRITAASMRDLGYGIGVVGEQYALDKGALGETPAGTTAAGYLNIAESEDLLAPVGVVAPE
jgi:hypothetical protein